MMRSAKKPKTEQCEKSSPFCWNQQCPDYGRVGGVNIIKFGFTRKGRQRYRCTTCNRVVAETRGTVFHGQHHSQETIIACLAMLADRNSLAAIHRVTGVKEETVTAWLKQVEPQMEQIEAVLLKEHKLSRAQLDALWTYVGHKGEKKVSRKKTPAAPSGAGRPSKLRRDCGVGRAVATTEEEVAQRLMVELKERGHPDAPPPLATDGKGAYQEALVETWGEVPPPQGLGRPPLHKQPQAGWQYLQVIKRRGGGRLVEVQVEVIYGHEQTRSLVGAQTS